MVKIENGVAVRAPLPTFLAGLEPVSLLDLRWTDPSLGVQALAWWPEEAHDEPLAAGYRWGDEVLIVDKARQVVVVTRQQIALSADEIAQQAAAEHDAMSLLVDAERDRRVELGFEFQDKHYQTRGAGDRENILGAMNNALAAIMNGTKEGELRWADPAKEFFWIAADNSRVPMDAQTALALGQAATARKSALVQAGSDLKAMATIPQDFTADKWWPV